MTDIAQVQEIDKEIAELQAKRKALLSEQRKKALKEAKDLIDAFDFTAAELGLSKTSGPAKNSTGKKPGTPKYANPADQSQTWSGKGRKPTWAKEHVEKGGKLDDLLIK